VDAIIGFNPKLLQTEDASGRTQLMRFLEVGPDREKIHILVHAQVKYFGKCQGFSTCHASYLKSTCCDFQTSIFQSLHQLGADMSLSDSNGDSLLHFFGHDTTEHSNLGYPPDCTYLDTAEDLLELLFWHGRLFDKDSQGTTAFSAILRKIECHIGYLAFGLLCKCGLEEEPWIRNIWSWDWSTAHRCPQFKEITLLDLLVEIVAAYRQKAQSKSDISIEIKLDETRSGTFTTEELVPLEEAVKYGVELDVLKAKWEMFTKIERTKWITNVLEPKNSRYRKGIWEDELKWAHDFLSEGDIIELRSRYYNAKKRYAKEWGRGWIPIESGDKDPVTS
jgi:hypothetical protein